MFALPIGLFFAAAEDPPHARSVLATASALTIGSGLGLWPAGRLLDRIGRWRGLRRCMLAGAGSLAVLAVAVGWAWPKPAVLAVATLSGVAWSPVIATPRALLPEVVPVSRLPWASGIEATSIEVALVLAPLAGALLGRWGPPAAPAGAAGLLVVAGVLLPAPADVGPSTATGQPLLSRKVTALAGLALLLGVSGGMLEPGLAALPTTLLGDLAGNAALFVAIAAGSAVGGLLAARTAWPSRTLHSVALFAVHAVALAGAATTDGVVQVGLLVVAGLPIAPLQSLAGLHFDRVAGPGRASETFGLVATVLTLATGGGQAIAARVAGRLDPHHLLLMAAALPMLAAILVALHPARRSSASVGGSTSARRARRDVAGRRSRST